MNVIYVVLLLCCLVPICSSKKRFLRAGHYPWSLEDKKENSPDAAPQEVKKNKVIRIVDDEDRRRSMGRKSHRSHRGRGRGDRPHRIEDLPESPNLLPGHALIRPARTMLKSAVKFPHDDQNLVYGNLRNLGITFGKTNQRDIYGGFRKANDFLGTLVKAIKEIDEREERKKSPFILVKPKFKSKPKSLNKEKLTQVTKQILDILESKLPVDIKQKSKSPKAEKTSPSIFLVKPKPKFKSSKGNRFKEITMKALEFLDENNSRPAQTAQPKPESIASTLQEITMKALNFLDTQKTDTTKPKAKSSISNALKDLTFKALDMLDNKETHLDQENQDLLPAIQAKFKEAVKSLNIVDGSKIALISKLVKKLIENENNKKTKSVIVLGSKPQAKLKLSFGKKLKDITMKLLDFLGNANSTTNRQQVAKQKTSKKKKAKIAKKSQDLLNSKGHIEFDMASHEDKLLEERTKKIQDFLNSHIPVINAHALNEDSKSDRTKKIQEFLSNQVPIKGAKDKFSLDQRTKSIQDFLNNQVPIFLDRDSLNDRNMSMQAFINNLIPNHRRQELIDEAENNANEILDIDASDEEHLAYRRSSKKKKRKFRDRDSKYDSHGDDESGLSASSDYEKNPGNPFTIHRNKYVQNWMWNHFMDGDHMNINPFSPPFASLGPTGADLFFGRKWWYFNQDDYKPLG